MMMNSQRVFMEQQQKTHQDFAKSLEAKVTKDSDRRKEDCTTKKPKCLKWDINESLESYCYRLEIWNRIDPNNKGKYLDFIDSLQESGRKKE